MSTNKIDWGTKSPDEMIALLKESGFVPRLHDTYYRLLRNIAFEITKHTGCTALVASWDKIDDENNVVDNILVVCVYSIDTEVSRTSVIPGLNRVRRGDNKFSFDDRLQIFIRTVEGCLNDVLERNKEGEDE